MAKLKWMLQLFAEGGAAGSAGEGSTVADAASTERAKEAEVLYGVQPQEEAQAGEEADAAQETPQEEAPRKSFKELINGEYKDEAGQYIQNVINKRFAETKTLEKENADLKGVMELVAARYGVDAGNAEALKAAIEQDGAFLQEQADREGMSVEQYQKYTSALREAERARQVFEQQRYQADVDRQVSAWRDEAERVKAVYPQFDLDAELANRDFVQLVKAQLSLKQAYEVTHMQELMSGTAQAAEERTIAQIQGRAKRPQEGAAGAHGTGAVVKNDVTKLTREDRERIAQEVMRGKKISFS